MDIKALFDKYKNEDNKGLLDKIAQICDSKNGKWDIGIDENSSNLTQVLIYEYATSIENLTNGKLSAEFVIDKLATNMGTLRFGDFKQGQDDNIQYGNNPVTSEEYKKACRINSNFGAHEVDYEEGGKQVCSIALFDDKQQYTTSDGNTHTLSGIDLENIDDIRHTIFHEWTHIMEKSYVRGSELKREDVLLEDGDSTYINACLSPDLSMQEYKDFINSVDSLLENDEEILFGGISTIEINENKSPDRRIMHNQISEGTTEYISRLVMKNLGRGIKDESRYAEQVEFAKQVFSSEGIDNALVDYFTSSNKIISLIESKQQNGQDLLHYADNFITFLGNFEGYCREEMIKAGVNPEQEIGKLKDVIMSFWEKGSTDPQELENYTNFLTASITGNSVEANTGVRDSILKVLNYPKENEEFKALMSKEFPEKVPQKSAFDNVVEYIVKNDNITITNINDEISEIRKTVEEKDIERTDDDIQTV